MAESSSAAAASGVVGISGAAVLDDAVASASPVQEKKQIFGQNMDFDDRIGPANDAIESYKSQLAACCRAVDTWSLITIRFKVVKDIRVLIGKMIWESRDLAEHKV